MNNYQSILALFGEMSKYISVTLLKQLPRVQMPVTTRHVFFLRFFSGEPSDPNEPLASKVRAIGKQEKTWVSKSNPGISQRGSRGIGPGFTTPAALKEFSSDTCRHVVAR